VRRAFIKGFDEAKQRYSDWKDLSAEEVQASYFASTKRKGAQIKYQDTSGKSKKDEEAYDLIMKDKERLLSSDTKQAFIFSHSALREGWDNPNIFQICTLNQTSSEIKKRQEIGRGIRLAVDETGDRIRDSQVNLLTVVANESYDQYVRQLQSEIVAEYGEGVVLPPKPANARKRTMVSPRKEFVLSSEFKELWEKIKTKTRYLVNIETEKLVEDVLKDVDSLEIRPPRIKISKAQFELDELGSFEAHQIVAPRPVIELRGRYPLPNLVDEMAYLLENTTPRVCLTRKSLLEIFLRTKNQKGAVDNPFEFASAVTRILKGKLADHLIKGIQYEKINEWYEMSRIMEPFEAWEDYVIPAERSVYDKVEFDSEQERRFVEDIEKMQQVKMYIKLPSWFKVTTPVGDYNPDWALVWEDRDEHGDSTGKPLLYLVRETKGKRELDKLRPEEGRKITCATRHFKDTLGVDYDVVTTATELP
jgi:type III restriction enzyme